MTVACLLIPFALLLIMGVPIAVCLGAGALAALLQLDLGFDMMPATIYASCSKFILLAIPFFILAGNIMDKSGISTKLIRFAQSFVGHKKGGLGIVCVIVACFFAAISGSGPATVAALGMIIIPAMIRAGYDPASSSALMSTAGSIGVIIPPSITFVVYGSITGVSIGKLFMAGIIPGLIMGFFLILASFYSSRHSDLVQLPKASRHERWLAFKDAFWGLLMPVIILGGIYGGIFTPTEAAAVSAVYGLLVGIFIYRSVKLKDLYQIFLDSVSQTAVVMFITATAGLFAWVITIEGIAAAASEFIIQISGGNLIIFLIIVNIILLISGCFIDGNSSFYIFAPIFYPVALSLGYDPIALGVLMVMNLAIGMVTPPVGVCLYVSCGISGEPIERVSKAAIPFLIASFCALLIITYIPQISLFLPGFLSN
ncbi:TRAP transporter large permease [Anaerotruncus sp. AF02-27]|uniref:TRAP transporter large permease n=1 Tax=Anaerotruncus TaxID=244127 RepID=UPI000E467F7C|nr:MULTISPECIES: TRAP transporter large permease [Anaerotruncus]RGX54931.1 TRAP transporter large permease [Anaerotruncus sp. AF02-27]